MNLKNWFDYSLREYNLVIPNNFISTGGANDNVSPVDGSLFSINNIGVLYPFQFGVTPVNVDFEISCHCLSSFDVYNDGEGGIGLIPVGSPMGLYSPKFHRIALGGSRSSLLVNENLIFDVDEHIFLDCRIVRQNGFLSFYGFDESTKKWVLHHKTNVQFNESFNLMAYAYLRGGVTDVKFKTFL